MKVILREDVQQLGKAGDVVEVKNGYARNYLLARNLAVRANAGQMRQLEHERKLLKDKKDKTLKEANDLAGKINALSCTIPVQVGEEEKMFGSVTAMDITKCLAKEGIEIDKKLLQLDEPIRALGVYVVPVRLAPEVEAKLRIWVVKE